MRRILITGADSYLGTSLDAYLKQWPDAYAVDTVDMIDGSWRDRDFSGYQAVYHVAGIVHREGGAPNDEMLNLYTRVNTDLAVETAKKAKAAGVRQFIFLSSMSVYGQNADVGTRIVITRDTPANPDTPYGISKLKAEEGLKTLEGDDFRLCILRPPMIYGRGCKGNYARMSTWAGKLPVFPRINNERSMLYINNLCEMVRLLVDREESGLFFPQNKEYVSSSDMFQRIARAKGRRVRLTRVFNPAIRAMGKIKPVVGKIFGSLMYDQALSQCAFDYQVVGWGESIRRSEGAGKRRVLILVNHDVAIYNLRLELVERLLEEGCDVHLSSPYGERIEALKQLGVTYYDTQMSRHGMSALEDYGLYRFYCGLMRKIRPDIVFSYTIKPNIYGALACRRFHVPCAANITGLGTAVENGGLLSHVLIRMYRFALKNIQCVFCQNEENMEFLRNRKIAPAKYVLLPGSGVNLGRYPLLPYPEGDTVEFAFISRIMCEKGIDEYLSAAKYIREKYPRTRFHVCGFCEQDYEGTLRELDKTGVIHYHGMVRDIREIHKIIHCTVHPTYYPEGLSNVLLESCASGRPIITTDRSGCREVVDDGMNGYIVKQKDSTDLIGKLEAFLALSWEEQRQMGLHGRHKVEAEFDRQIVVRAYMHELDQSV